MKQYTITIPDDKNEFFVELIRSLGFVIQQGDFFSLEDANIQQWQIDIIEQRIKNASPTSYKNWDDIKDQFRLDG